MLDWDTLDLPNFEDVDETINRLNALHTAALKDKNLSRSPDKNSPGFSPCPAQAREVATMSCLGLEAKEIALVLNIEEKLLKLYYAKELKVSTSLANAMVARRALQMAMSGRFPDMTKFWLKSRAKWKETSSMELSGPDGKPMEFSSAKEKFAATMAAASSKANGNAAE